MVPAFAESVSEGDVRWEKKVGDQVKEDDVLCEIETDKVYSYVLNSLRIKSMLKRITTLKRIFGSFRQFSKLTNWVNYSNFASKNDESVEHKKTLDSRFERIYARTQCTLVVGKVV